jgi:AcrR family transcriptional regulator
MASHPSDLTAAARIRDAALAQFAARGVAATSIRDVAKAAGVSPGLVQHHFRSKAGLRRAVEEQAVSRALETFGAPIPGESPAEATAYIAARISAFIRANPAIFAYLGRSILEGDTVGVELFQRFLGLATAQLRRFARRGLLRPGVDIGWIAVHVILIDVGAYLFEDAVSRYLGESLRTERGLVRMERATEALFLHGVFAPAKRRVRRARKRRLRSHRAGEKMT